MTTETASASTAPFGRHALPGAAESVRRFGDRLPRSSVGRLAASALRRICLKLTGDAVDVTVADGVRARLYPRTNRCEKRVLTASQFFDEQERAALSAALAASTPERPFVFLDVGANVGFYSLFLAAEARRLGKACRIVAVEPDAENLRRLRQNIAFSEADAVAVEAVGISGTPGRASVAGGEANRGEARVSLVEAEGEATVVVETLPQLIARLGLTHVDAMKIDIEGHDLAALRTLFADAAEALWPRLLVAEVGRVGYPEPVTELCLDHDYEIRDRARLNVILARIDGF